MRKERKKKQVKQDSGLVGGNLVYVFRYPPSAADVIAPSLSTLISANSSSSWVCPDNLRRTLRRCQTLTPLVNICHVTKKK